MDPQRDDFGWAPHEWAYSVGSVLLGRADGKEMTPQQVEALCYYSSEQTTDMFQDASEHEGMTGSKEELVKWAALFNPETFRTFFADFKCKKTEKDASWARAVSPI